MTQTDNTTPWKSLPKAVTTYLTAQDARDAAQHFEGNFPGGAADLHYRFTLAGGAISRLVIEP